MERKIGEVFEYNGVKLKVIKEINMCSKCYFQSVYCKSLALIRGECQSASRTDGGVIFVKVEDMEEKVEIQKENTLKAIYRYLGEFYI